MLPTLIATLLWAPALVGLGGPLARPLEPELRLPIAGLGGLAVLAIAGMALHPLLPLRGAIPVAVFTAGWVMLLVHRRELLEAASPRTLAALAVVAIACAALTQFPSRGGKGYDAGLYHLQAIEWIRQRPQVRGLASLYGPLGYDVSWFVVAAVLELPGMAGRGPVVINGLPIVFAAAASAAGLRRLASASPRCSDGLLAASSLAACLAIEGLAFPGYDDVLTLLAFVVLALWMRAFEASGEERGGPAIAATVLSALAATVKLSAFPLLAGSAAGLILLRRDLSRRHVTAAVLGAAALLVPWLSRGLLSSGCLAYPAGATCLDLPWTVSAANAEVVASAAVRFARAPPLEQAGPFTPIARHLPYLAEAGRLPLLALLALTLLGGLHAARGGLREASSRPAVRFAACVLALGVTFWSLTAPNPRFGVTYLLPLAALAPAAALAGVAGAQGRRRARALLACGCVLYAAAAGGWTLRKLTWSDAALLCWPAYPAPRPMRREPANGMVVNVPPDGLCWEAPLPCAPAVEPGLAWRGMFVVPR